MKKWLLPLVIAWFLAVKPPQVEAVGQVLGVHILHPAELDAAVELLRPEKSPFPHDAWTYVTIPLSLDDLKKADEWQRFFDEARKQHVIPLVRLVTRFENGAWAVPTRKDITDEIDFLSGLNWPTDQRYVIMFNEVNHESEWGGHIDPIEYAQTLRFASNWAHSEGNGFVVLPAALDLAAPNGKSTKEAFGYLKAMLATDPDILDTIDIWNSHSYPNPGFSSAPTRTAQNSLRGFEHELAFLKKQTGRDFQVMITETGWVSTPQTRSWLEQYYRYALDNVWSNPAVLAVTPFVLQGDPGPFSDFSFIDRNGHPTSQYHALQAALGG